jgi:hypothetical protein
LFGLKIRSEISLPELLPDEFSGAPDVTISRGVVSGQGIEQSGLHGNGKSLMLLIPDVARYRIENGRAIIVEALPSVPERNVRLYLLGSGFGALLHQRGLLPLHANAIEVDGKAVAFMGPSGAGKSTLAAWFHDRGYGLIADDVCVVRITGDKAMALPGLPRLRLWQDALEASGRTAREHERSYSGDESWNKFDVPAERSAVSGRPVEISAIYRLSDGDDFRVEHLSGSEAAEAVIANTYRGSFLKPLNGHRLHWSTCVALVRAVPVFGIERRWGIEFLDDQYDRILAAAKGQLRPAEART